MANEEGGRGEGGAMAGKEGGRGGDTMTDEEGG